MLYFCYHYPFLYELVWSSPAYMWNYKWYLHSWSGSFTAFQYRDRKCEYLNYKYELRIIEPGLIVRYIQSFDRWPELVSGFANWKIEIGTGRWWAGKATILILTYTNCISVWLCLVLQNRCVIYLWLVKIYQSNARSPIIGNLPRALQGATNISNQH